MFFCFNIPIQVIERMNNLSIETMLKLINDKHFDDKITSYLSVMNSSSTDTKTRLKALMKRIIDDPVYLLIASRDKIEQKLNSSYFYTSLSEFRNEMNKKEELLNQIKDNYKQIFNDFATYEQKTAEKLKNFDWEAYVKDKEEHLEQPNHEDFGERSLEIIIFLVVFAVLLVIVYKVMNILFSLVWKVIMYFVRKVMPGGNGRSPH